MYATLSTHIVEKVMSDCKHSIAVESNSPARESFDKVIQFVLNHLRNRNETDSIEFGIEFLGMSGYSSSQQNRVYPGQCSQEEKETNSHSMYRSQKRPEDSDDCCSEEYHEKSWSIKDQNEELPEFVVSIQLHTSIVKLLEEVVYHFGSVIEGDVVLMTHDESRVRDQLPHPHVKVV